MEKDERKKRSRMLQTQRDMFEAGAYRIHPNSQLPRCLEVNECAKQLVQSSIDAASIHNNEPILLMRKEDCSNSKQKLMNLANEQYRKTHLLVRASRAKGSKSLEKESSTKQPKKNRITADTSWQIKAGLEQERDAINVAIAARNGFIRKYTGHGSRHCLLYTSPSPRD